MVKTDKRLQNFFNRANKLYFDGKLPSDTIVSWNDEIPGYGLTVGITDKDTKHTFFHIYIDPEKHVDGRQSRLTLLHEMAHVRLYPDMRHGRRFEQEMIRLAIAGAFKGLW